MDYVYITSCTFTGVGYTYIDAFEQMHSSVLPKVTLVFRATQCRAFSIERFESFVTEKITQFTSAKTEVLSFWHLSKIRC